MKLKTVLYLSAFAWFSFGFGSCSSCGKKKPDDKPNENKSSTTASHDYAVDKVAQEMEWAIALCGMKRKE